MCAHWCVFMFNYVCVKLKQLKRCVFPVLTLWVLMDLLERTFWEQNQRGQGKAQSRASQIWRATATYHSELGLKDFFLGPHQYLLICVDRTGRPLFPPPLFFPPLYPHPRNPFLHYPPPGLWLFFNLPPPHLPPIFYPPAPPAPR